MSFPNQTDGISPTSKSAFRTAIGLLLLTIGLQSCLVVHIGKNPSWKTAATQNTPTTAPEKPAMQVEVGSNKWVVPLVFMALIIDRKHYDLHFWVMPPANHSLRPDSITYRLYDPEKRLISQGSRQTEDRRREIAPALGLYFQPAGRTKQNIVLDKTLRENLSVIMGLHYKDSTGRVVSEEYQQTLQVETQKRVRLGMARN